MREDEQPERQVGYEQEQTISFRPSYLEDPYGWLNALDAEKKDGLCERAFQPSHVVAKDPTCHVPSLPKSWRMVSRGDAADEGAATDEHDETTTETTSPADRSGASLTRCGDYGLVLFGGGRLSQRRMFHFNDVWVFNGLTATWKKLPSKVVKAPTEYFKSDGVTEENDDDDDVDEAPYWGMKPPPARRYHAAQFYGPKKFLIVFSGLIEGTKVEEDGAVWLLDLVRCMWKRVRPGPASWGNSECVPKGGRSQTFLYKDHFYIIGGDSGEQFMKLKCFKLGPLSAPEDEWLWSPQPLVPAATLSKQGLHSPMVTLDPHPFNHIKGQESAIVGNKFWLFGGLEKQRRNEVYRFVEGLFRLDLETWEWSNIIIRTGEQACFRMFHGMESIGRFLIVMGGMAPLQPNQYVTDIAPSLRNQNTSLRTFFDLFCFDTELMVWKQLHRQNIRGEWPAARCAFSLARFGNSRLVLFGGGVFHQSSYNDTYVIEVQLPDYFPTTSSSTTATTRTTVRAAEELTEDLTDMLRTGLLSDLTLVLGNGPRREWAVHKNILAARCDYFRILLDGPYKEADSSEIDLFSPSTEESCVTLFSQAVDLVLRYFYSGTLPEDEQQELMVNGELLHEVMTVVDMWNVTRLARRLERMLAQMFDRERHEAPKLGGDMIVFARDHNLTRLKLHCFRKSCNTSDDQQAEQMEQEMSEPELAEEMRAFRRSLF